MINDEVELNETYFIQRLDAEFYIKRDIQPMVNYKIPSTKPLFTDEEYRRLEDNLILHKQGNKNATAYIVKVFHDFLTKYARFIKNGDIPFTLFKDRAGRTRKRYSSTIKLFANLFVNKNVENTYDDYSTYFYSNGTKKIKRSTLKGASEKICNLFSKFEYMDIYNELTIALLNMADKYKILNEGDKYYKKNGTFHMYVAKCFHWEAYRVLDALVKDPLAHLDCLRLCNTFDDFDDDNRNADNKIFIEDKASLLDTEIMFNNVALEQDIKTSDKLTCNDDNIDCYNSSLFNFNWINGVSCDNIFKDLNNYERELIVLTYIMMYNTKDIAKKFGLQIAKVRHDRACAVNKIRLNAIKANVIDKDTKEKRMCIVYKNNNDII